MPRFLTVILCILTLSFSTPSLSFSSEAASQESGQQGQHSEAIAYLLSAAAVVGDAERMSIRVQSDDALGGPDVVSAECCKVCRKGKACGDSCIARSKQCTKGPGCACDG